MKQRARLGVCMMALIALAYLALAASPLTVNVEYPNTTYLNANHSINITLEVPVNTSLNQSYVLWVDGASTRLANESNTFRFTLNTSLLGTRNFSVMLMLGNLTSFNKSYSYWVTDDMDRDGFAAAFLGGTDCNDQNTSVNPNGTEIPWNGVDDDCDNSTSDTPTTLKPSKLKYKLGEMVRLEVMAEQAAIVPVAVYDTSSNSVIYLENVSGDFPMNVTITGIKHSGNYSVNLDNGGFLEEKSRFEVFNSITGSIGVEPEQPWVNNDATFEAKDIGGGFEPYTYKWSFGDGKTGTGRLVSHTYAKMGEYTVTLEIKDKEGNTKNIEATVDALNTYKLTVIAKDSETKQPVRDAEVVIDDIAKSTDSKGKASFELPADRYSVGVYDSDYEPKTQGVKVTKDTETEVLIKRIYRDEFPPRILLLRPVSNSQFFTKEAELAFTANDSSEFSCTLLMSNNGKQWKESKTFSNMLNNSEQAVQFSVLGNGTHSWKVLCKDEYNNEAESPVWNFTINTSKEAVSWIEYKRLDKEAKNRSNELKVELDELLDKGTRFTSMQREVAGIIGWQEDINRKRRELDMLTSDVYNLRFRKINNSERLRLARNRTKSFDSIMSGVISDIHVSDTKSMVYYPSEGELNNISLLFVRANGHNPEKYNLASYEQANQELQLSFSVTTNAYHVEFTYMDGNREKATLISKSIKGFTPKDNLSLVEYVPKTIAANTTRLHILTKHKVLLDDPLVEFFPSDNSVVYWTFGFKDFEQLKSTHLVVLKSDILLKPKRSVTGFSVLGLFHLGDSSSVAFLAALVVVVLLSYYLLHSLGAFARVYEKLSGRRDYGNAKKINQLVVEAYEALDKNELEKACILYKEIELFFKDLSGKIKLSVIGDIQALANRINLEKIDQMLNNAVYLLENSEVAKAKEVFNHILSYYNQLTDKTKADIVDRLNSLREMIEKNE